MTMNKTDWISSDLHFYHKNILKFNPATRPYENVGEMNAAIIADWQKKVMPEDTMIHLGDFAFASPEQTRSILQQLPGHKVFLIGNHDGKNVHVLREFGTVHYYLEWKVEGHKKRVILFHYPIESWNKQHHGSVHLHGHTHGSLAPWGRREDAGWDAQGGEIVNMKSLVDKCYARDIITAEDHHNPKGDTK